MYVKARDPHVQSIKVVWGSIRRRTPRHVLNCRMLKRACSRARVHACVRSCTQASARARARARSRALMRMHERAQRMLMGARACVHAWARVRPSMHALVRARA
eukprot:11481630-Alexandrium_andersonii.AAC.1